MENFLREGSFTEFSALEVASNLLVALVLALVTSFVDADAGRGGSIHAGRPRTDSGHGGRLPRRHSY